MIVARMLDSSFGDRETGIGESATKCSPWGGRVPHERTYPASMVMNQRRKAARPLGWSRDYAPRIMSSRSAKGSFGPTRVSTTCTTAFCPTRPRSPKAGVSSSPLPALRCAKRATSAPAGSGCPRRPISAERRRFAGPARIVANRSQLAVPTATSVRRCRRAVGSIEPALNESLSRSQWRQGLVFFFPKLPSPSAIVKAWRRYLP